ncbi:MAG: ABC transporter substrate-binding protein, partial [Ktedonobacteraceae bacterium]|nr:ABC transporter substrate-binding protein [Ktedonobacteraceae bacterium]
MHFRFSQHARRTGRAGALALLFLLGVLVLSACASSGPSTPSSTTPKKGGTLNVGLIAEPTTLEPLKSVTLYDTDIMANIYDTLFKYDSQLKIQPYLVSSYTYTTPTQLDMTLRTDVKFQDGTPFNADAVVFNINRYLNDKTSPRFTDVVSIDKVVKVSDDKVQIKLKQPFAPLLNVLTGSVGMMLSPTAVQKLGSKLGNTPTQVGSGPYTFVEWIKGDHLLLKANPNYWQKDKSGIQLPYLQTIRYRTITNANVMYNNLETNQIQLASNIDPNNLDQIKSNPELTYRQIVGPGFQSLQLNESKPPLNNIHVRRAIAWAIDRAQIVHTVLKDVGVVAKGPISPISWAYSKDFTGITFDANKAKDELAQSGVSNPTFTLLATSGNPTTDQEIQLIQAQLKTVGITMNIKQEIFTTVVQDFQTFNYQAVFIGWTGSLDPDGTLYPMFTSKGGFNYTKYSDKQVDTLLDKGRTTIDQAQRVTLYQQAEQMIVEEASRVFINHGAVYQASSSKLKNYT